MIKSLCVWLLMTTFIFYSSGAEVIRINQLGYLTVGLKIAVIMSDEALVLKKFRLLDNIMGDTVFEGVPTLSDGTGLGQKSTYRLNFSSVVQPGGYHLEASNAILPSFIVSSGKYKGTVDFILQYMRQQRCGDNPFLKDSCHTADGIILDHQDKKENG